MNPISARTFKPKMIFNYESSLSYDQQEVVYHLIRELLNPKTKQNAILELSKIRDDVPDMGPLLWYTFGALAVLLQEIIIIYPKLSPPRLSNVESNSACSALALLQCTAAHPETRQLFLNANIHRFIYPFLDTVPHTKPLEYLKLTSLGVIGALVKNDEQDVINFLLSSEIIPSCLRNMEYGSDLSKTVATYIMQRILSFESGLNYICQTYERFSHVADVLNKIVYYLLQEPSSNLVKLVVRCYLHLSENPRAREALRQSLPDPLKDDMFMKYLKDDRTRLWLDQLHENLRNL